MTYVHQNVIFVIAFCLSWDTVDQNGSSCWTELVFQLDNIIIWVSVNIFSLLLSSFIARVRKHILYRLFNMCLMLTKWVCGALGIRIPPMWLNLLYMQWKFSLVSCSLCILLKGGCTSHLCILFLSSEAEIRNYLYARMPVTNKRVARGESQEWCV